MGAARIRDLVKETSLSLGGKTLGSPNRQLLDNFANADWRYGMQGDYLHELVQYWLEGFDWRQQEREINRYRRLEMVGGVSQINEEYNDPSLQAASEAYQLAYYGRLVFRDGTPDILAYPKDRSASAKILGLTRVLRLAIGDPPYWEAGL